ncbi:MAG: hypothetical protein RL145_1856 [Pseudomonadota bacterium]|jgi:uncharacterized RDD family membrane protein YckC
MSTQAAKAAKVVSPRRSFVTPEGVDLQLEIGDASQRAGAFLIDLAIIIFFLIAMSLVLALAGIGTMDAAGIEWVMIVWILIAFAVRNFYFTFFELSAKAATPGKRMMGLRVAARHGGRLEAQAVLVRNIMRELEVFIPISVMATGAGQDSLDGWMYLLTFVWVSIFTFFPLFNKDRLRIGDLVGGTWVVRTPKQALLRDMADDVVERSRHYNFTDDQLAAYGIKELQVLEQVLRGGDPDTLRSVAQRICTKIGMTYRWDQSDEAFLNAYYQGLRGTLESKLLMGNRRADKFDR